jgi:hypothetical protein
MRSGETLVDARGACSFKNIQHTSKALCTQYVGCRRSMCGTRVYKLVTGLVLPFHKYLMRELFFATMPSV